MIAILNFPQMMQLLSALAPFTLCFFLVMASLFNQDVKGLVYLAGVTLTSVLNVPLMHAFGSRRQVDSAFCQFITPFTQSNTEFDSPSPSLVFLGFTLAYLVLPMTMLSQINYPVLIFLLALTGIDASTKVQASCTTFPGAVLGLIVGIIGGIVWFTIFHQAQLDSLLYFRSTASDKVMCSKPTKQTFKCSVYRNGQLVTTDAT